MKTKNENPFLVLEVGLEMLGAVAPLVRLLARKAPDLARQVRRAAQSVPMNIAEGNSRVGRDRLHHFRVASGSAREVIAGLRVALAFGDLEPREVAPAVEFADRTVAMLYRLTN